MNNVWQTTDPNAPNYADPQYFTIGPDGFPVQKAGTLTPGQRDNPQAQIHYDPVRDLNYTLDKNGQRLYQSPVTFTGGKTNYNTSLHGNPSTDSQSLFHGSPEWNQQSGKFEQHIAWGNILSMVVAGTLTASAAFAMMGSTPEAAAALTNAGVPSSALPGAVTAGVPTALPGAVNAIPPLAGATVPGLTLPGGVNSPPEGSQLPSGSGISALLKALTPLGGVLAGHALQGNGSNNVPPQLNDLLNLSVNRAQSQQPLFNAMTNGVYQMLPNFAKTGKPVGS